MFNINKLCNTNRIVLPIIFLAFASTIAVPIAATSPRLAPLHIIQYVKIEELKNRLLRSYSNDKSSKKIVEYALEIKQEIELTFGTKLDSDLVFLEIELELDKAGVNVSKTDLETIKSYFHKREKKFKHKGSWDLPVTQDTELDVVAKPDDPKKKHSQKIQKELLYGFTIAFVGEIIMVIPSPEAKEWGSHMVDKGITICSKFLNEKKE